MNNLIKATVLGAALVWTANAHALDGDVTRGEAVFKKCKICHAVGPTAKPGVGPVQNNLVGATAGARPGFNYSQAMKDAGATKGIVWTEENLDKYLTNPKAMVPGNKMAFPGLPNAQDRADVIAYLKTQTGK